MNLLSALMLLVPSPVDLAKRATRPNNYARPMGSQAAIGSDQMARNALRGGLSGQSGSEGDYQLEQHSGNPSLGAPLNQFVPSARRPPSAYTPNLPARGVGQGTGPYVGPFKGWVDLRGKKPGWRNTTLRGQHVLPATLLVPTDRSPLPRDVVKGHDAAKEGHLRLQDYFGD